MESQAGFFCGSFGEIIIWVPRKTPPISGSLHKYHQSRFRWRIGWKEPDIQTWHTGVSQHLGRLPSSHLPLYHLVSTIVPNIEHVRHCDIMCVISFSSTAFYECIHSYICMYIMHMSCEYSMHVHPYLHLLIYILYGLYIYIHCTCIGLLAPSAHQKSFHFAITETIRWRAMIYSCTALNSSSPNLKKWPPLQQEILNLERV